MPPKKTESKLLTETELQMMQALWKLNEGTVHEVQETIKGEKKLAYTSVSTILRILEQKGFVKSRKDGRGHVYLPTLAKENYEKRSLGHMVKNVFQDEPKRLVQRLIELENFDSNEIAELKALLDSKG